MARPKSDLKRVHLHLPAGLLDRLDAVSEGRPLAELVRQALFDYVEKREREVRK